MNYGHAIRVARAVRGLSQKALAKRANLDSSYVSLLEKNSRVPSPAAISSLVMALGMPIELFQLLAAEQPDLKFVTTDQAAELGRSLLKLLALSTDS